MQTVNFEATIKDGIIKIPKRYSRLNNVKVIVKIPTQSSKEPQTKEMQQRTEKIIEFIDKYKGILKSAGLPDGINTKDIRMMRLKEQYDI